MFTTDKKFKAQMPYRLYLWLKQEAKESRQKISDSLKSLIVSTLDSNEELDPIVFQHAREIAGDSPNNVHWYANKALSEQFRAFMAKYRCKSESETARAIVAIAFAKDKQLKGPTLFDIE